MRQETYYTFLMANLLPDEAKALKAERMKLEKLNAQDRKAFGYRFDDPIRNETSIASALAHAFRFGSGVETIEYWEKVLRRYQADI